ncbi:unnamed protein product [Urochloa decumbens]|uniref:AAA+ ATPase domain-containing protein n=1 Tax=Urochloa decumbens TaxID=240449 RepID=A0ABC8YBY3_9POAL
MEIVTGALSSVISKLGELLIGEYNLQKGVKGEIMFLQAELESMKGALQKVSSTPPDKLDIQDKIWARDLRELSYDIEDSIDTFMVCGKSNQQTKLHGINKFIDRSVGLFRKAKGRHRIAFEIRDIKSRVLEVHKRRRRYEINLGVDKPVRATVDPRLLIHYTKVTELVGIDEARDELIKIIMQEEDEAPMQQGKIVSIVGFGGLGKTTLANAVHAKIRALFDCCAFISVSQTPDFKKLFKGILYQLDKKSYDSINEKTLEEEQLINELRDFLQHKRYMIVIDDIWEITVWKIIRRALPDNDIGYKIITTTRNIDVAKQTGATYLMKPLSLNNSRKLLYRRIFGNQEKDNNEGNGKYIDEELDKVTDKILKKCAGIPLAIITIASLLARKERNKMDWYEVCSSVGSGLESSLDWDNMRKILSFSYYDLPSHLRTCLLYLSIFPEDYEIGKDRLIWMWIAEGFIQCKERGHSLFQVGESYFNELINRFMIQPVYDEQYGMLEHCRVHDMMLDLIRSFSNEENFVTILNDMDHTSPSNTVRRLSLQHGKEDRAKKWATGSIRQVRSIVVFQFAVDLLPAFQRFGVLRVLHLEGCNLSQCCSLKYLEYLLHLRYLGLINTSIPNLPDEVGNLQYLQTLDVMESGISCLPTTVLQLKKLMCLRVHWFTRVPGIGTLTSLEELSWLRIDDISTDIIEELGLLTELRVLRIAFFTEWNDKLAECLRELKKILIISVIIGQRSIGGLDTWVAPRHLRRLETRWGCWFATLPAWLNPSLLLDLSFLSIDVRELQQKDLEILGRLPALYYLDLRVDCKNPRIHRRFVVGARFFPCLVHCALWGFVQPVVFERGAMPKLTRLVFTFSMHSDGGIDLGLGNLASLQEISVCVRPGATVEEVDEAKAKLRQAAEIHPNRPTIHIDEDEDSDSEYIDTKICPTKNNAHCMTQTISLVRKARRRRI